MNDIPKEVYLEASITPEIRRMLYNNFIRELRKAAARESYGTAISDQEIHYQVIKQAAKKALGI